MHPKHGAYYLVQGGKWIWLGKELSTALAEYGRRIDAPKGGMATLIDSALEHIKSRGLASSTVDQYTIAAEKLKRIMVEFSPAQVRGKHVAQIKLSMSKTPNMANRVLSFLRQVFDYAVEQQIIESNPALGIKRHKEKKRGRLISMQEFDAIYGKADSRLQVIMDLLYLTAQRITDVLTIGLRDLVEDGISFKQQKTGVRLIVRWTPELRSVVARAKALYGNVRALTLLHNRRGKAPDYRTIKEQWDAACKAAGVLDAHLHDIRAMSLTAAKKQGKNPTALAGHTNEEQTDRYLRDRTIPIVDGPSFGRLIDGAAQVID